MELDYAYDAFKPYISAKTMMINYNRFYLKYLKKLSITDDLIFTLKHIDNYDINERGDIIYNIGGVINHELFFNSIGFNNTPKGKIKEAIIKKYGNYEKFKTEFIDTANKLVGSGFIFLVLKQNELDIINLSNNETPYSYNMIPILALDLYEHAYLFDYIDNREDYIKNFFQIIDFNKLNNRYEQNIQT